MIMRSRILVIDDEEALCEILRFNLCKDGYDVDVSFSAEEALERDLTQYSLFIVDVMMDKLSGFDFAGRVRNTPSIENTPIIFCSALTDEDDKVMGLNIGGDDYITKPFNIAEVKSRVRAVLRRADPHRHDYYQQLQHDMSVAQPGEVESSHASNLEPDIVCHALRINRNAKTCTLNEQAVPLTRTEYDMLTFFLTHTDRIYSREEIISNVWGRDVVISNRTIDTNITRLRKKIGEYGNNIVTRQGFGYGWRKD